MQVLNTSNLSMFHCPKLELCGGNHNLLSSGFTLLLSAKEIAAQNWIWGRHQNLEDLLLSFDKGS